MSSTTNSENLCTSIWVLYNIHNCVRKCTVPEYLCMKYPMTFVNSSVKISTNQFLEVLVMILRAIHLLLVVKHSHGKIDTRCTLRLLGGEKHWLCDHPYKNTQLGLEYWWLMVLFTKQNTARLISITAWHWMLWIFNVHNTAFDEQEQTAFCGSPYHWLRAVWIQEWSPEKPRWWSMIFQNLRLCGIHLQLTKLLPTRVLLHNSLRRTIKLNQGHWLHS